MGDMALGRHAHLALPVRIIRVPRAEVMRVRRCGECECEGERKSIRWRSGDGSGDIWMGMEDIGQSMRFNLGKGGRRSGVLRRLEYWKGVKHGYERDGGCTIGRRSNLVGDSGPEAVAW